MIINYWKNDLMKRVMLLESYSSVCVKVFKADMMNDATYFVSAFQV